MSVDSIAFLSLLAWVWFCNEQTYKNRKLIIRRIDEIANDEVELALKLLNDASKVPYSIEVICLILFVDPLRLYSQDIRNLFLENPEN